MEHPYKCSFCFFSNKFPEVVRTHERKCPFNPINRNCCSCLHLTLKDTSKRCLVDCKDFKKIYDAELPCPVYEADINAEEIIYHNEEILTKK